jgi:hypothetical protein
MQDMERKEFNIRDTMNEIGRLQWVKNKFLEELRENKTRWEEEKKREKEEMVEIELKLRQKHTEIE